MRLRDYPFVPLLLNLLFLLYGWTLPYLGRCRVILLKGSKFFPFFINGILLPHPIGHQFVLFLASPV
jgi:hypothetical protein